MEHPEVAGKFIITSHRVGNTSAGVDAGERRADKGEKDGKRLDEHEPPAGLGAAEDPGADNLHHVANRCRRSGCLRHLVPAVQEVIRGKILEQDSK